MFASAAAIFGIAVEVISGARVLLALGKDIAPQLGDLKKLFSGEKITVEQLAEMRARNDALNAEIESQTESGV